MGRVLKNFLQIGTCDQKRLETTALEHGFYKWPETYQWNTMKSIFSTKACDGSKNWESSHCVFSRPADPTFKRSCTLSTHTIFHSFRRKAGLLWLWRRMQCNRNWHLNGWVKSASHNTKEAFIYTLSICLCGFGFFFFSPSLNRYHSNRKTLLTSTKTNAYLNYATVMNDSFLPDPLNLSSLTRRVFQTLDVLDTCTPSHSVQGCDVPCSPKPRGAEHTQSDSALTPGPSAHPFGRASARCWHRPAPLP